MIYLMSWYGFRYNAKYATFEQSAVILLLHSLYSLITFLAVTPRLVLMILFSLHSSISPLLIHLCCLRRLSQTPMREVSINLFSFAKFHISFCQFFQV